MVRQRHAAPCPLYFAFMWVWVKIKPPGIGPQVLVHVSTYQGKPFWVHIFDSRPFGSVVLIFAAFGWLRLLSGSYPWSKNPRKLQAASIRFITNLTTSQTYRIDRPFKQTAGELGFPWLVSTIPQAGAWGPQTPLKTMGSHRFFFLLFV